MSIEIGRLLAPALPAGLSDIVDERRAVPVHFANRRSMIPFYSSLCSDGWFAPTPSKLTCCSGRSVRQRSNTKTNTVRETSAAKPIRICPTRFMADSFGAGGRDNLRRQGGQASFPSSSVTHSRQYVP